MHSRFVPLLILVVASLLAASTARAERPAFLQITVLDVRGRPIRDAAVTVKSPQQPQLPDTVLLTDIQGRITFSTQLTSDTFCINVLAIGFQSQSTWIKLSKGKIEHFTFKLTKSNINSLNLYNEGLVHLNEGDNIKAAEKFQQVIRSSPRFSPAYASLAQALLDQGDHLEAADAARQATVLDAENARAWPLLYEASAQAGNEFEAQTALEALAGLGGSKKLATRAYNIGVDHKSSGRKREAAIRFKDALVLSPNLAPARLGLAALALEDQDLEKALKLIKKVLAREPDNQTALRLLLLTHSLQQDG